MLTSGQLGQTHGSSPTICIGTTDTRRSIGSLRIILPAWPCHFPYTHLMMWPRTGLLQWSCADDHDWRPLTCIPTPSLLSCLFPTLFPYPQIELTVLFSQCGRLLPWIPLGPCPSPKATPCTTFPHTNFSYLMGEDGSEVDMQYHLVWFCAPLSF